jgi:AraC-like DNA-binding protein
MLELGETLGRIKLESSEPLIYLNTSVRSGWSGACLTHMRTVNRGSFEGCWSSILVTCSLSSFDAYYVLKRPGHPEPYRSRLAIGVPLELRRGGWNKTAESANLFINPSLVERVLGFPYQEAKIEDHAHCVDADHVIEPLMYALLSDIAAGSPDGAILGETIVAAIIHRLQGEPESSKLGRQRINMTPRKLAVAQDFIEANLARNIHLDDVAMTLGMSVRHLCRAFRATTGLTPHQYILRRRLESAKSLILAGGLSLEDVAHATGFADRNHMTATFRKILNATPSEFRVHSAYAYSRTT